MMRVGEEVPPFHNLLGALMAADAGESGDAPSLLGAVASLSDLPARGLVRGQVGAIVEALDDATVLVEFSDEPSVCDRALSQGYVDRAANDAASGVTGHARRQQAQRVVLRPLDCFASLAMTDRGKAPRRACCPSRSP